MRLLHPERETPKNFNIPGDTAEIIQAFIEKPTYDSSNRLPTKATPELLEAVEQCLQLNRDKRLMGLQKQIMKKIDIHAYLKKQGFDVSYSTVKRVTQYLETKHQEAFIRQEYEPDDICEFDWGTVKLDIGNAGYQKYQMAVFASAYGNFRYTKLYLTQDTAAFQESHADFFAYSHGAFRTMADRYLSSSKLYRSVSSSFSQSYTLTVRMDGFTIQYSRTPAERYLNNFTP